MENEDYLKKQLITYLGNKRKLLEFIGTNILNISMKLNKEKLIILDGFSGSGIVSRYLKKYASILITNDLEYYSYIINKCYMSNKCDLNIKKINELVNYLNSRKEVYINSKKVGLFEEMYCPKDMENILESDRCFYTKRNAKILDGIRRDINRIPEEYKKFIFAPLLSEMSIHVNTSGVFKGFYKSKKRNRTIRG